MEVPLVGLFPLVQNVDKLALAAPSKGWKSFPGQYVLLLTRLGAHFYVFGPEICCFKPQIDVGGIDVLVDCCSLVSRMFLNLSLASGKGWKSFPRPFVLLLTRLGAHFFRIWA